MLLTNVHVKSFKADLAKGDVTLTFALDLGRDTIDARWRIGEWLDNETRLNLTIEAEGEQLPLFVGAGEHVAEADYATAVVHDEDAPVVEVEDGIVTTTEERPDNAAAGETLDEFIDNLDMDGDEDSPTGMQEG